MELNKKIDRVYNKYKKSSTKCVGESCPPQQTETLGNCVGDVCARPELEKVEPLDNITNASDDELDNSA